jgi:methionine biosynthesis protein MetW
MTLRPDLQAIADLVTPNATLLDVGCGDGDLLYWLANNKKVKGRGIELSQAGVHRAISKGLSVIQGNANLDLQYYPDKAYDFVVLSQTLQTLNNPREVLEHLVRIADHTIVSVPNFGYWKNRLYLACKGRMPVTKTLSFEWYDTPNIHFCTIADFEELSRRLGFTVEKKFYVDHNGMPTKFTNQSLFANFFGEQGIFMIKK